MSAVDRSISAAFLFMAAFYIGAALNNLAHTGEFVLWKAGLAVVIVAVSIANITVGLTTNGGEHG